MSKIPFNMKYSIGDDLREVPDDAVQMQKGLLWLQENFSKMEDQKSPKAAATLSRIGTFARMLGDLEVAESSFQDSLVILEEKGRSDQALAVKLRLAIVHQFKGDYAKADNFYVNAIKVMKNSKDERINRFLDFALQHLAKSRFEQKFYREALDYSLEALEIRLIKGDMDLIQSTEQVISKVRANLDDS